MANSLPLSELLDVLTDLVKQHKTGTMYVHSESNHAITFALDKGRITALYYGPKRGRKAIGPISNIERGTYHFQTASFAGAAQDLPSTLDLLNLLRERQLEIGDGPPSEAQTRGVSLEQRNRICQELKELLAAHLGPIADLVFDSAKNDSGDFCATPEEAQEFIGKLAADIDDAEEAIEFQRKASAALRRMLALG